MFPYAVEQFTSDEAAILRRYVTNLDQPVFALVNLPEVVKGALFARYSRSAKSLRRLFLDEFVGDLEISGDATVDATVGLARAESLYERVFLEYGDDSVAQLGGVHLACEQSSNLLTKILERPRLMSYLEQSTRYIGYDLRLPGGRYRYYRPPEILESAAGARYVSDIDRMFDAYAELLPVVQAWVAARHPKSEGDSDFVHRQAVRAKALDALRGLLPAASLSNVGIYGSGQSYELLLLHLRHHPLPEARHYGTAMLAELRKVIPSFLQRIDRPERGGEWAEYLAATRDDTARVVARLWPEDDADGHSAGGGVTGRGTRLGGRAEVVLTDFDPEGEDKVLAAICFPHISISETEALRRVRRLSSEERVALLSAYIGDRKNRRHRPGRALERTDYRFEIVSDYGAFRDLQRHRMLSIEWQPLSSELGYDIPEIVEAAGVAGPFEETLQRSRTILHRELEPQFPFQAPYAVALAFHIRYVMQMNAREALHLLELRSGSQGHPVYRRVAQKMHRALESVAGHRALAAAMVHVDHGTAGLERLESERRAESRRAQTGGEIPGGNSATS